MPDPSDADQAQAASKQPERETIPDTLISILIALILAFVFRGFVVEAFVIPTGSMAPTLMGKHMRVSSDETGYVWQVAPWQYRDNTNEYPLARQGAADDPIKVHDPMSGQEIMQTDTPLLSGDRILVLKFLYSLFEPNPFDVIVFKNPTNPSQNYIKRLIGLPNETIALVDGDVWVYDGMPAGDIAQSWSRDGWKIRRKPARVQRSVWQPMFDSSYATEQDRFTATRKAAWTSDQSGWDTNGRIYEYTGTDATRLDFEPIDTIRRRGATMAMNDRYPYDEGPRGQRDIFFNVSDVRLRAGVEIESPNERVAAVLEARNHIFEAIVFGGSVTLSIRPAFADSPTDPIERSETFDGWKIKPGRVTNIDFWHADQQLALWIDGALVGKLAYDAWTPADRFANATDRTIDQTLADARGMSGNPLARESLYKPGRVAWEFGGAVRLHRVRIDRDLYYRPATYSTYDRTSPYAGMPALATHPEKNAILAQDQFFVLGDNSPQSLDGRLWGDPNPWVTDEFEAAGEGVIPRDMLLGKAFFVYFPSLHKDTTLPVPDTGRLRFIH